MRTVPLKLLTVVAEALLRDRLVREIERAGARGWTITTCEGQGSRGVRASEWEGGNVKIETIVRPEVADRIFGVVADGYFAHYAVVVYVQDVHVARGDKYA